MTGRPWLVAGALVLCAGAAIAADVSATVENAVEKIEERLPEIRVKETVVEVTPEARVYLPSGSLDLSLRQDFPRTVFTFASQYDFVDNYMGFTVDIMYKTMPFPVGIVLNDRVDFNEIFADTQYLQRSQSMMPYVRYTFSPLARAQAGLRIENTYTSSLGSLLVIDKGKNIVGEAGVSRDTIVLSTGTPLGGTASLVLQHSFPNLGSDYEYTLIEGALHRYHTVCGSHYLEYSLRAGYPVDTVTRPLTALYYAGGYRLLRGYDFKEFRGDALLYGSLIYHVPIARIERPTFLRIPLSIVTWDLFIESGKIGDRHIFAATGDGMKTAAGSGIGYSIVLFNRLPVEFGLAFAKAFEARAPQYYVTVTTAYYTWGNQ